jgi:hypothetical protein
MGGTLLKQNLCFLLSVFTKISGIDKILSMLARKRLKITSLFRFVVTTLREG